MTMNYGDNINNEPVVKLSVIIVNYNVRHFLNQCLHSVRKALRNIEGEIIVADNNSVDGSCLMIEKDFPEVILIRNTRNEGFSKANNRAIGIARGQYILLLNPDTVVQEDTFEKCLAFMDQHPEAGALGVKMIDGKGHFLPESKRGLPSPAVAFYKMSGLFSLFPRSSRFNRYYLGHLPADQIHEVDVLSGAFMLIRKAVLEKTGLLDESFFMYGEDIDLSYRIQKAGYKNYYFPETTIIHYKGESTKKGSLNYTIVFYKAMIIFARKHYSRHYAGLFSAFIHAGIYFHAFLSLARSTLKKLAMPAADAFLSYLVFYGIASLWSGMIFKNNQYYPPFFYSVILPVYILVLLVSIMFYGGYDKPYYLKNIFRGILTGMLALLAGYALLPLHLRFSRAVILLGSTGTLLVLILYRAGLHLCKKCPYRLGEFKKRILIVGSPSEAERISSFLAMAPLKPDIAGWISPSGETPAGSLGTLDQYNEIVRLYAIEEVIFSARDIPSQKIIELMLQHPGSAVEYKIAPPESMAIVGSNSVHSSGELYLINLNGINKPQNRRKKRLLDVFVSCLLLIAWPVMIFVVHKPGKALHNIISVLSGKKTWVGYNPMYQNPKDELPLLKPGIFSPDVLLFSGKQENNEERKKEVNIIYAKDYKALNDFIIICKNIQSIGI